MADVKAITSCRIIKCESPRPTLCLRSDQRRLLASDLLEHSWGWTCRLYQKTRLPAPH